MGKGVRMPSDYTDWSKLSSEVNTYNLKDLEEKENV
jgi:hypothetical protein